MTSGFDEVHTPRLVLAGAGSSTGKTTLTAGLLAAYRRRGVRVTPFKVGPDHEDAALLAKAAGSPCRNLDPWILGRDAMLRSFHRGCVDADLAIVEGMLGLYDSWGAGTEGSTAELSKLIEAPVVLVLDVASTVQSAAALALGFKSMDPRVGIAGVILNRVADDNHARWVEEAVWQQAKIPVLGAIPALGALSLADEGAATGTEGAAGDSMDRLVAAIERHLDLDLLQRIAEKARPVRMIPRVSTPVLSDADTGVRLGVAYDEAFNLYYPENLEILSEAGAEIVPFSLLHDSHLPNVHGLYIAGASSDRYAEELSGNAGMRESVRQAHNDGMSIYAECGGLMYLARAVVGPDGGELEMAGLLPLRVRPETGVRQMGYREMRTLDDCILAARGQSLRGHELHWSKVSNGNGGVTYAYELFDPSGYRVGHEGYTAPGVLATNIHLHFGQDPQLALNLLWPSVQRHRLEPVATA
ncbi:MAG TPA: cobyrinate a,c-diamide synthase [Candidatus Solibacter sp.]|nr:cobyrinate a,c-diamide synthase [Candidatus Solibacter sp.]